MNKIEKIHGMTVKKIQEVLSGKGIKFDSKAKKEELKEIVSKNSKAFYIGVHSGSYYFSSRRNTHAGNVCRLIALEEVKSKQDIRKKYTTAYTFKQTLERLNFEGIISFTDKKHSAFELTSKGKELAKKYVKIYG